MTKAERGEAQRGPEFFQMLNESALAPGPESAR